MFINNPNLWALINFDQLRWTVFIVNLYFKFLSIYYIKNINAKIQINSMKYFIVISSKFSKNFLVECTLQIILQVSLIFAMISVINSLLCSMSLPNWYQERIFHNINKFRFVFVYWYVTNYLIVHLTKI